MSVGFCLCGNLRDDPLQLRGLEDVMKDHQSRGNPASSSAQKRDDDEVP